jgi:hypothetical protein
MRATVEAKAWSPIAVCATLQGVKCNASCESGANFRRQISFNLIDKPDMTSEVIGKGSRGAVLLPPRSLLDPACWLEQDTKQP